MPLSLIEAQASRLPVLASTVVPKESDVTGLCIFIELCNPHACAEAILSMVITKRHSYAEECHKAGYDIHDTANWLQEYYESLSTTQL